MQREARETSRVWQGMAGQGGAGQSKKKNATRTAGTEQTDATVRISCAVQNVHEKTQPAPQAQNHTDFHILRALTSAG